MVILSRFTDETYAEGNTGHICCVHLICILYLFSASGNPMSLGNPDPNGKMMPMGWTRSGQVVPPVLPKHGAQDALGVVYENGSDIAQDKIYRYKNAVLAFFFFRVNNQLFFPSGQWRWSDLDGKDGWGLNGDQKRIQCGYSDDPLLGHLCVAVVRYGPFISEFSSPIEEGIMTYEEFKAIVHAIDEQITSCLQKSRNQR